MTDPQKSKRLTVYAATVFLLYCFFMLWEINFYLAGTLKSTYYMMVVPALVAGVLYFRGVSDGIEAGLLLSYWIWFWITRVLNSNPALVYDFQLTFDLGLMLPFFLLGFSLDDKGRRRFLDWFSAATGGYHFLLGLVALSAFIESTTYINPITEGSLGIGQNLSRGLMRINILDTNPDSTAYWFMMAFFLMVYQFFACRRKLWRIPIVFAALVDFAVISITYTRSVMLAIAVALGLLALLLLRGVLKMKKKFLRVTVLLLCFLLCTAAVYESFGLCVGGMSRIADTVQMEAPAEETVPSPAAGTLGVRMAGSAVAAPEPLSNYVPFESGSLVGRLDEVSSLRLTVWRSAFLALRDDPSVLWRGQLEKDMMLISNTYTPHDPPHYHNALIQVLMSSGLPGLLLILALLVLTVLKAGRLFFSSDARATLAVKTLTLPVIAVLIYSMLETMLFTRCEVRPLYYYLMSGMMLGYYYDIHPRT